MEVLNDADQDGNVSEDTIRALNTEILGGRGADVLILDGLPGKAYQEKGIFLFLVYDGFEEMLQKLKAAGKRLVVATSKPEPYAKKIIEHFGLSQYFDYVAGMELDGGRGTKADVIRYALLACGIEEQSEVLMVGDREHDVIGAKKAGIDCLGVLYGFGSREELEQAGADYIVKTVAEIGSFHRAASI